MLNRICEQLLIDSASMDVEMTGNVCRTSPDFEMDSRI